MNGSRGIRITRDFKAKAIINLIMENSRDKIDSNITRPFLIHFDYTYIWTYILNNFTKINDFSFQEQNYTDIHSSKMG